jgi:tetratricopeptide (TPR) repeat protein
MNAPTTASTEASQAPDKAFIALLGLFPVVCLGFGTVHAWPRVVLAVACVLLGWRLWRSGRAASSRALLWMKGLSLAAVGVAGLPLLPVGPGLRELLQGELAGPINQMLSMAGAPSHPLALDPWRALIEWSVGVGLLCLGWGVAAWVGRSRRASALAWSVVLTCVGVVLLAFLQWGVDATSIYGSGIPGVVREPFFGPFVNANHGGALCAAGLPLALAIAANGPVRRQVGGLVLTAVLCVGVFAAGSRGGVFAAAAGAGVVLLLGGSKPVKVGVLAAAGLALILLAVLGPYELIRWVGDLVAPEVSQMVDAGYVDLTTGRRALLLDTGQLVRSVWPLGVGPAGFDEAYQTAKTSPAFMISQHAHNDLLQAVIEHGLLVTVACMLAGILWIVAVLQGISASGSRPDRQWWMAGFLGAAVAIGVAAMVDFPMRLGSHSLLLSLCIGASLGLARPRGRGRKASVRWRRALGGVSWLALAALGLAIVGRLTSVPGYSPASVVLASGDPAEALRLKPTHRAAAQLLAAQRVKQGEIAEAEELLRVATHLYPTMPWLWRDRARLAQRQGQLEEAEQLWHRMLALDLPGRTDPLPYVREALLGGDDPDLMATAQRVLPDRADRRRQGARIFAHMGLQDEAEQLFKEALQLDPRGTGPYASALLKWGRPADVLEVLSGGRDGCGSHSLRAQARLGLGEHALAVKAFERAIGKCGRPNWALQAGLGQARLMSGESKGEQLVLRLLAERPEAHALRRTLSTFLVSRGRSLDAAPHLEALVQAGVATQREQAVLPQARRGLPVRLQDLTGRPAR